MSPEIGTKVAHTVAWISLAILIGVSVYHIAHNWAWTALAVYVYRHAEALLDKAMKTR